MERTVSWRRNSSFRAEKAGSRLRRLVATRSVRLISSHDLIGSFGDGVIEPNAARRLRARADTRGPAARRTPANRTACWGAPRLHKSLPHPLASFFCDFTYGLTNCGRHQLNRMSGAVQQTHPMNAKYEAGADDRYVPVEPERRVLLSICSLYLDRSGGMAAFHSAKVMSQRGWISAVSDPAPE